jgi:hypothetical protein
MNQTIFILGVFPILVGILIFAISSNVYVYAQQLSPSPAAGSSSNSNSNSNSTSVSNTISPELKAKMCDPSNPSLKVVNTTESRICGIPKTVKPHSLSLAVTPPTSAVSLPPQQQTTITKPTTAAASVDSAPPKQQQIATTNNNNTYASSLPTGGATRATIAPVSNPSNKSLSSSSSSSSLSQSSAIAPQIKAVNQQHKQHQLAPPITLINGTKGTNSTAGQNYTFAASSPAATSDKPLYLGYHDTTTTTSSAHGNSGSKHNDNTDSKHHTHRSTRSTSDNSSEGKDTTKRFSIPHIKIATADIGSTATKKKAATDTKPFTPFSHIRIPLPGNDFTGKTTTTHSTKLSTSDSTTDEDPKVGVSPTNHHRRSVDKSSSTHTKPFFPPPHIIVNAKEHSSDTRSSSHTDFSRGLLSSSSSSQSPSDLGSDIRSKVDSFIRNNLGGVRHGLFG